jgi:CDP-diacylglycerol pyrophosphatase
MAAKLARLTHKIAIQLHLVAESCIVFSSCSRWSVRKVLDTPSCSMFIYIKYLPSKINGLDHKVKAINFTHKALKFRNCFSADTAQVCQKRIRKCCQLFLHCLYVDNLVICSLHHVRLL